MRAARLQRPPIKAAFEELTEQVKKHKELLRNHHKFGRRRGPERVGTGTVPFEQTLAAVKPETVSADDISNYVDVNLPRLKRFIQRELDFREREGQIPPGQMAVDDVVGEAIADALSEQHDKPERMKLEPWLYRLAKQAIEQAQFRKPGRAAHRDGTGRNRRSHRRYSRGAGGTPRTDQPGGDDLARCRPQ